MNEKFAHTAGPWLAVKYTKTKFGLGNPGDSAWMMLAPVYTDTSDCEMRANARLISAAPELLEAAYATLLWWADHKYDTTGERGEWNLFDDEPAFVMEARAAIAKATGKTSEAA